MVEPRQPHAYRPDVEGLRAVAVLAVVLFHVGVPGVPGGYVGVDVFFVLSGFLITGLLLAEVRTTGTVSLRRFWARRARRLLPLATLVSVVTLVASWLLVSPLERRAVAVDAVWSGLFAMNLHLAREGVDYLADDAPSPYQHYWSLAVEEQFYLLWPVLVLLVVLLVRGASAHPGRARHAVPTPAVVLAVVTALLVAASFAWGVVLTAASQPLAYFQPWSRAWELGAGALLAVGAPLASRLPQVVREAAAGTGLLAVAAGCLLLDDLTPFPGTAALLPVLGTAAVVLAGLGGSTRTGRLLSARPLRTLGRLSYGWYLWHWPVLLLAPALWPGEPGLLVRLLLAAAALGLAAVTYALVEDPVRRHPGLVTSPWRSLAAGVTCVAVAAGSAVVVAALPQDLRGPGPALAPVAAEVGEGEVRRAVAAGQRATVAPANLVPELERAPDDVARGRSADGGTCMVPVEHLDVAQDPGDSCVFGRHPDSDTTVVLAGDSHAYQWYPAMLQVADERGWRLVVLSKAGCPLYDVSIVLRSLRRDYTECDVWREAAMDRIAQEGPELVVTSAAVFSPRGDDFTERWAEGVAATTRELRERTGAAVVSLQDTPIPGEDIPSCVADHLTDVQECSVPRAEALSDPRRRSATAQAAAVAGATVVDPVPWFCDEACPAIIGNTLAYHDDDHITATYAQRLAPVLARRLEGLDAPDGTPATRAAAVHDGS